MHVLLVCSVVIDDNGLLLLSDANRACNKDTIRADKCSTSFRLRCKLRSDGVSVKFCVACAVIAMTRPRLPLDRPGPHRLLLRRRARKSAYLFHTRSTSHFFPLLIYPLLTTTDVSIGGLHLISANRIWNMIGPKCFN